MQSSILLIDDNAVQAATRQAILRRAGYFVIAALSPVRALEQLRDGSIAEEVHLVITDHIMPAMRGSEFVRQLRVAFPKMPVIVISGLDEAEQEYYSLNVDFRVKPVPPPELLALVASILGTTAQ
jgi:CheY-like chemotaxis protein